MTYRAIVGVPGGLGATGVDESQDESEIALLGATTAAMNLYVDPVSGADTNPGTAALPFRTLAAAHAAVPQTIQHDVLISLANGTYAEPLVVNKKLCNGTLRILGNLALAAGEVQRTASVGLCSATTIGTLLAGWGVDAHLDKWIEIVGGTGSGQVRKIQSNTADTLTVGVSFSPAPNGTSVYQIRVPQAKFTSNVTGAWPRTGGIVNVSGGMFSRSVAIRGVEVVNGKLDVSYATSVILSCVALDCGLRLSGQASVLVDGELDFDDATYIQYQGSIYVHDDPVEAARAIETSDDGASLDLAGSLVRGGCMLNSCYVGLNKSRFILGSNAGDALTALWIANAFNSKGTYAAHGARFDGISRVIIQTCDLLWEADVRNTTHADGGVQLMWGARITTDTLVGTGNAGVGIRLSDSSCFNVNPSGFHTTITGAGGDFKAGNRPIGTWANRTTYGPDEDSAIQRVIGTVPGGGGNIATRDPAGALNGVFGTGEVQCVDLTASVPMVEDNGAPADGHFQVNYGTGAVTFHANQAAHVIRITFKPISYTGAFIG